ncbi:MAG: hypothetical protein ACKOOE_08275 [Micrococcales bacterium]
MTFWDFLGGAALLFLFGAIVLSVFVLAFSIIGPLFWGSKNSRPTTTWVSSAQDDADEDELHHR